MPKITGLPPGASLSSGDLIVMVDDPAGSAVTQYATLAQLRVALYGLTGADPITAGAASFTTGAFSGALTYGGVTLSNAVTGTGNMVLSASPTLTGTITAAIANFSGAVGVTGNLTVGASTFVVTAATGDTNIAVGATASAGITITGSNSPRINVTSTGSTVMNNLGVDDVGGYLGTVTNHQTVIRSNATARLTIAADGSPSTFATPLAITGALTGVTTLTHSSYIEGTEMAAPAAGAANTGRIFFQDNGAGKTQLMCIFASGAAQQLAIEP